MSKLRPILLLVAVAAFAGAELPAQVIVNEQVRITGPDGVQMMGPGREMKSGTGRIRGRILAADSGNPVRRAQLRLSGAEVGVRTAITDAEGRYEFSELPAGRFTINVTKSGYVTVQYGQTRPFESGKAIELGDKQVLDRADIAMPRGGVIAGRLVDEFGEGVPDAAVQALRSTWSNGRRRLQPTGRTVTTNDLGQYRLFGLPPGEYYVSATLGGGGGPMMTDGGDVVAVRAAVVSATAAFGTATGAQAPTSGYAPTYYPGTTSGAEALRVPVSLSQEMQGADFALVPVRLARVSGTVINSEGRPVSGTMVNLVARSADTANPIFGAGTGGRTDANGNFTINSVAPGDYVLQARGMQIAQEQISEGRTTMVFTMGGPGGGDAEVGSVPITVAGEDVSHVIVMTAKGARATGRVTFEGGGAELAKGMRVMASPFEGDGPAIMTGGSAAVQPDGRFELGGLAGGRIIRLANVPQGWTLKAVRLNGEDITDTGAEFRPGDAVSGLEIVLTNRLTSVTGSVSSGRGEPVTDFTVVIFSDDQALWTVPQSRHVTGVRPDQQGRFDVRNLPPGGYYAIALEYIEQGTWGDPDVLARLKANATTFSLREGEQKALTLMLER